MPSVEIEDSHVDYRVDGQGPGLILVHGAARDADSNWGSIDARLSAHRTVIRPNYSGSGATVDRGGPLTLERLGRQIVASAWAAGAAPFDLVGFGLGAGVAAYVAATIPDLVRSLVLIAGYADANDPALRLRLRVQRRLVAIDPETLARVIVFGDHSAEYRSQTSEAILEQRVAALLERGNWPGITRQLNLELGLDLHRVLPAINCPTLVIAARHDHAVAPRHAAVLASTIQGARSAWLPGGHLTPIEQPDALASLLTEFVLSEPAQRSAVGRASLG